MPNGAGAEILPLVKGTVGSFSEADDKPVMAGEKPIMEEVKIK